MKLYALLTLHETGWGTRAGIGDPSAATAALSQQNTSEKAPIISSPQAASLYVPSQDYAYGGYGDSLNQRHPQQYQSQPQSPSYGQQQFGRQPPPSQQYTQAQYDYSRQTGANFNTYAQ